MARPSRCRRVCAEPDCRAFVPQPQKSEQTILLTVDEYEVIRLVDYEKRTHEQCAAQMQISRTTVTEIYESARGKLADSLVSGKPLHIAGGNYRLCRGGAEPGCGRRCRWRETTEEDFRKKGDFIMRIAVTYENGQIFQHFGHTEQMKLYDVENGQITRQWVEDTAGSGHGALAGFLASRGVEVLICGGIGGGAQMALTEAGIQLYGGVSGSADAAVAALLEGKLDYDPDVHCNHHAQQHGEGGHSCGEHGCGHHSCG